MLEKKARKEKKMMKKTTMIGEKERWRKCLEKAKKGNKWKKTAKKGELKKMFEKRKKKNKGI